ncbi:hypothetical protein [Microbacterium gorillae]|uniref:hypothetical protein n=1 Tax=Microbacterium gorillae TaxID=1231063 RepID=UPI00058CC05B|nr:hypothetical protein [Microbacterium gorillae]
MRLHPLALIAAVIVALEGVLILIYAGVQLLDLIGGGAAEVPTAIALLALTAVFGVGMLALAYGIARERTWGRSGGIVMQILLASVGLMLPAVFEVPGWVAVLVVAPAVVAFALILIASRRAPEDADER